MFPVLRLLKLFLTHSSYNCKLFGMRSGDEHQDLHVEMFNFGADDIRQFLTFNGDRNKTTQGGLRHAKLAFNSIKHYIQQI